MQVKETIKKKIADDTLSGDDLPAVLDAIVEIVQSNEDTKELLQDMAEEEENVWINFEVEGIGTHCLQIVNGKIEHIDHPCEKPTATITSDKDTMVALIAGKVEPAAVVSEGRLGLKGDLAKAMSLVLILNVVADELGVDVAI